MAEIPTGSKVILRHNDGSKIVARKTKIGYESGHVGTRTTPGWVDDDWIATYGWHIESFEAPLILPTTTGTVIMFSQGIARLHLAWLANDGKWDMILSRSEVVNFVEDPLAEIEAHGYDRPTSFTEYVPKED